MDKWEGIKFYSSMTADSLGYPHIIYCYYYLDGKDLKFACKYARYDGKTWHIELVEDSNGSLVLDQNDQPHISYGDAANLIHASYQNNAWRTEVVAACRTRCSACSIILDTNSSLHIIYFDMKKIDEHNYERLLRHAYQDEGVWHTEDIDLGIVDFSLALDSQRHFHAVYTSKQQEQRPRSIFETGPSVYELRYAFNDGSGWQAEVLDTLNDQPAAPSLVLDSTDRPHISYRAYSYEAKEHTLKYARHDGDTWKIETVDSYEFDVRYGGLVILGDNSLALDGNGHPHIGYIYATDGGLDYINSGLKYAFHDGKEWHTEIIELSGDVGYYVSLVLDQTGRPHLSYKDSRRSSLKYAHREEER